VTNIVGHPAKVDLRAVVLTELTKTKYIAARQLSHRSSHAMPHKIFDDVEERG
jgi:hypothetical protein